MFYTCLNQCLEDIWDAFQFFMIINTFLHKPLQMFADVSENTFLEIFLGMDMIFSFLLLIDIAKLPS